MIATDERGRHQEVWLLLPWLANGRLAPAEREMAEEHVRRCPECERELALQHIMYNAFTEPDRVTYAPGPSFRKVMERIDAQDEPEVHISEAPLRGKHRSDSSLAARLGHVSLWRPPGIAWAASFLILFGITGMMFTAYRWSAPVYKTHTDAAVATPNVLHIALDRTIPIGDAEELLHAGGARIVEGPGTTGILGITPVTIVPGQTSEASANKQLRALSARLRQDPRVLWVQPLPDEATLADAPADTPADTRAPDAREH
jgi:Putative zinc-finger